MNIQIEYSQKILLLENFMQRMRERKNGGFILDGVVTQAERNALYTALQALKVRLQELKLMIGGDEDEKAAGTS